MAQEPPNGRVVSRYGAGLRLAVSTLTIVPVGVTTAGPGVAGAAMACAPLVGAGLGTAAGLIGLAARWWTGSNLIGAVIAIGVLAVLTRALHLDGLADTADGLGANRPAPQALAVMKRSDIGPFGVTALILTLVLQIACLSAAFSLGRGLLACVAAAASGRLTVTFACTTRFRAARPDGLGAWVAGTVRPRTAAVAACGVLAGCGALGLVPGFATDFASAAASQRSVPWPLTFAAVAVGAGAALALLRHCVQRFGGITGDVLGALIETGATGALFVLAFR